MLATGTGAIRSFPCHLLIVIAAYWSRPPTHIDYTSSNISVAIARPFTSFARGRFKPPAVAAVVELAIVASSACTV